MKTKEDSEENKCSLEKAVDTFKGKWKILIIRQIMNGKKRPSEFLREIQSVDRRVLNIQLKEMISDGLLVKKSFNELPPRVEYKLTELGQRLIDILWKLNNWGEYLDEKNRGL